MRKSLLLICLMSLGIISLHAQNVFTQVSAYDTLTATPDSLHWTISNPAPNAYGAATLTIYFQGDFGDPSEYLDVLGENLSLIGSSGSSPNFSDCNAFLDSMTFMIPASQINAWASTGNNIMFHAVSSINVDMFCADQRAMVKLTYNYCTSPTAQVADFGPIADSVFCPMDQGISLFASPAGGVFTGMGVTGTSFSPSGLSGGNYTITYTVTDATGCTSSDQVSVKVSPSLSVAGNTIPVCPGSPAMVSGIGADKFIWYIDPLLTTPLDTTIEDNLWTTPVITQDTTFYVAGIDSRHYFMIDSFGVSGYAVVDHNTASGDDRGGVAITPDYFYVVGDNNTVRMDVNLNTASFVSLPVRDGLFSNLASGQLYTLHNGSSFFTAYSNYVVTELAELDSALNLTGNSIQLSQPLALGNNNLYQSGIFAGKNMVIIYNGNDDHFYLIEMPSGQVTDLGVGNYPNFYWSENWADWGIAESDGVNYSVLFRGSGQNIERMIPGQSSTVLTTYSNVSDLSSFTYSPWNNRMYFHYEGSGQFGGSSETAGYVNAGDSSALLADTASLSCPIAVHIDMLEAELTLPVNDICYNNFGFILSGGIPAGGVYSGTGVNNGVFDPSVAGVGTHFINYAFTDNSGCTVSTSEQIVVSACAGIQENGNGSVNIFPNPGEGDFTLGLNLTNATDLKVEVISLTGQIVHTQSMSADAGLSTKQINLTHIADGIYQVRISGENTLLVTRLVKQ